MKIAALVPMYNEEGVAQLSVETIMSYVQKLPDVWTLVVINDGSKDRTAAILKGFVGRYPAERYALLEHPVNQGYGAALRTGIRFAIDRQYDYVVFMDSDLTNHPKYLKDFYQKMLEGYDYIKASRYIPGGRAQGVPFKRVAISYAGNLFARLVTGLPLTDFTNGFRAAKVSVLKQVTLTENSYPLMVEELMKVSRLTKNFCEIPSVLENRSQIAGNSKFKYNIATFRKYIQCLFVK